MTTYEIASGNYPPIDLKNNNPRNSNNEHSIDDNLKDKKISQLRAKLYDLKQREKDYDSLNQRYKQLQNDYSILNEAKLRLEYEIRQRESEYNRRITDLKGENETLQLGLNDKMTNSKKLFSEKDLLEREVNLKNNEINDLNGRLSDLSYQLDRAHQNRNDLAKMANNLNDSNINQNEQIFKLKQDNMCLTKICQDNERSMRMGDGELNKLSQKNDEINYEMQNLNKKVQFHESNINDLQRKLDCCTEINLNLQKQIRDFEKEFDNYRNENDGLKNDLLNQRTIRGERENQNEKLKSILMEKERQLSQLCRDSDNMRLMNRDNDDKNKYYKIENDKLRKQVRVLENQNKDLINEIENILSEDRKMKEVLTRKNRITSLLRDNNDTLERSINNLDTYINKSCNNSYNNYNYSSNSPRYTYQMGERSFI